MRTFKHTLLWGVLWGWIAITPAWGSNAGLIRHACQSDEEWNFGSVVPANFRNDLGIPPEDEAAAFTALKAAFKLRSITKDVGTRYVAEYLIARSLYGMKWVHSAHGLFLNLVQPVQAPSVAMEAVGAAISCLAQIHREYSGLRAKPSLTPILVKISAGNLNPEQRHAVWQVLASLAGKKLSDHQNGAGDPSLVEELRGLSGSGPYLALIQTLSAVKRGAESEAISFGTRFLSTPRLPEDLKSQVDAVHLILGRMYYNRGDYRHAVQEFEKISKDSNFSPSAFMDAAWAYFIMKDYQRSAGYVVNLVYKEMSAAFSPHAPILLGIIHFENCRYKEAYSAIRKFRKKYAEPYKLLYRWHRNSSGDRPNFYSMIVDYFEGKKTVPKTLITEWVRSPVFLGLQSEMNLLLDEKKRIGSFNLDSDLYPPFANYLRRLIEGFERGFLIMENRIVEAINHEILWRNYHMAIPMIEAFDNSQLLEAEVLKELGTSILTKKTLGRTGVEKVESPDGSLPLLKWGEVDDSETDGQGETWKDEIGGIRAEFYSQCETKRSRGKK